MGPTIILDKSALQCLSRKEVAQLYKHYYLNIPPVLILEILGDLKKYADDEARCESKVKEVADKLLGVSSITNCHYKPLVLGSLLGQEVAMVGKPVIADAVPFQDSKGEKGLFRGPSPEEIALLRWRHGDFGGGEQAVAERWREITKGFDLEEFKRFLRQFHKRVADIDSLERLGDVINEAFCAEDQVSFIAWTFLGLGIPRDFEPTVLRRWRKGQYGSFRDFAPYAHYCLRVNSAFELGLVYDLIGTRPTNRVDMEYLFYLPFCNVFCSADKFQSDFSQLFLGESQGLVPGHVLKADLKEIASFYEALTQQEREDREDRYGDYPPENPKSITYLVWKKHMGPPEAGMGGTPMRLTKGQKDELMQYLRPKLEAIEELVAPSHRFKKQRVDLAAWIGKISEGYKTSGGKDPEALGDALRSELHEAVSDRQRQVIEESFEILMRCFFQKASTGATFGRLDRMERTFGETIQAAYRIERGAFFNLAKTYWTYRLKVEDIRRSNSRGTLLAYVLREVERTIGCVFFPIPGPVRMPVARRRKMQADLVKRYAPGIDVDDLLQNNPILEAEERCEE